MDNFLRGRADSEGSMTKPSQKEQSDTKSRYRALVDRGEFQFGEPKNSGSSLSSFIGTVKRVAKNFNSDYVFVRPKSKKK